MALVGAMLIASPASANGNGHHNGDTINNIADTDTLVVEGDDDRRNPVASAQFSVARGACTGRGVGLQTPLAGVSAGGPDSDCVLLAGADSFDATGTPENIEMADKMRKRFFRNVMLQSNLFKTLFKMLPLVGGFLP
jgi:hypothetical protein